jgi:hypothetical protein
MVGKNNTNKILTIVLALIICISAIVILYVNLPKDEKTGDNTNNNSNGSTDNNQTEEPVTVLTVIYGNEQINYTLDQIKSMVSYTGIGAKINKKLSITGPYNYTGVKMSTFLSELKNLKTSKKANYSINTTSKDGYSQHFTYEEIQGSIEKLNETRVSLGYSNFTLIIAYMQEGDEITDSEDGPLMIVFVDDYYTDSGLWVKQLATIELF